MTLCLRLFGQLEVGDNAVARARPLRPRAQRLLAFLLLHRHRALTRESVAFTLWPDSPEPEALGTLRRALSDLRAALPTERAEWIITSGGMLRWNPDAPCWLDLEEFERCIRQGTATALQQAVALYAGDLLAEWGDEWVWGERERLRQLAFDALRQIVAHHRTTGDYADAIHFAQRTLALDPLAETAHRDLIAARYASGDRAAALAAYDRLRALLHDELGVEPMAETQALRDAIIRGLALPPAPAPIHHPAPAISDQHQTPAPIGRDTDLAHLAALWDSAAAGRGRLAIISGEAGVGKSHLARALADYATRRGGLALVGHCYEFESALPYQVIVELLRSASDLLRPTALAPAHRAALARLAPDLFGEADGPATAPETASAELRAILFEALLQTFLAAARDRPLLLLVEDAHWAAATALDWLTYITPRLGTSRLLVAITHRTDEVSTGHPLARLQRRFVRDGAITTLALRPLSREAHQQLVAHLSGLDADRAIPVADRLFRETSGNPFYLHEIVRGLIEAGRIVVTGERWAGGLIDAAPAAAVPMPDSLREAIIARTERLSPPAGLFLRVAAVAGRAFRYAVVQRAGGWPDEQGLAALEDLLARGFIAESSAEGEYAFAHHLMQEAIYADLAAPRRVYWHRRLAETLAQAADRLPAAPRWALAGLIVHHARQGEDFALVFRWAPLAAEHATALYAYADALGALEAASDALDRLRDTPEFDLAAGERQHVAILLQRAWLMTLVGRPVEEQGRAIELAAELLARYPDKLLLAKYHLRQSSYLSWLSQYDRAIEASLKAYARYRRLQDDQGAANALYLIGGFKITISQNRAGRRYYERALALFRTSGDAAGETLCLSGLAWSCLNLGEIESALHHLALALALGERRADRPGMARGYFALAGAWAYYRHAPPVQEYAERALQLSHEMGYVTGCRALLYIAEAHRIKGELPQARAACERAVAEAQTYYDSWVEGWASQMLGRLALGRGELEEAERHLCHAYHLRQEAGELQNQISDLTWLGRLRLAQGQEGAALAHTSQAIAQLESLWGECWVWEMPDVFMGHAEALAVSGDDVGARAQIERAHDTLVRFAAQIREPAARQSFLDDTLNARIIAARETGQIRPWQP